VKKSVTECDAIDEHADLKEQRARSIRGSHSLRSIDRPSELVECASQYGCFATTSKLVVRRRTTSFERALLVSGIVTALGSAFREGGRMLTVSREHHVRRNATTPYVSNSSHVSDVSNLSKSD
jgi:hypothetical protein